MLYYIFFFGVGILVGRVFKLKEKNSTIFSRVQSYCVYFILFLMGLSLGDSGEILGQIGTLGFRSVVFAVVPIIFSVLFVNVYERFVGGKR